jgi:hypothetical protein
MDTGKMVYIKPMCTFFEKELSKMNKGELHQISTWKDLLQNQIKLCLTWLLCENKCPALGCLNFNIELKNPLKIK